MNRALLATLALAAACDGPGPPPSASLPWIRGLDAATVGDTPTAATAERISGLLHTPADDDYGGLTLRADLTGDARAETVLASYQLGIAVTDAAGRLLARAPGLDASGSADELLAVAVGDGQLGTPVILVAAQTGGHRTSAISLSIYRMAGGRALQRLFSAPIELHDGSTIQAGSLSFIPGGLLYRAPDAASATRWTFNARRGRYEHRDDLPPQTPVGSPGA